MSLQKFAEFVIYLFAPGNETLLIATRARLHVPQNLTNLSS